MKKILAALSAALILAGCSVPANTGAMSFGPAEDYEKELAFEVKDDDGKITDQLYILYNDGEKTDVAGKLDVHYRDDNGELRGYEVTIGTTEISELVTYTNSDDGSVYYNEIYFDGELVTREVWDNLLPGEGGSKMRYTGENTYYPGTSQLKTAQEKVYRDGELESEKNDSYDLADSEAEDK